MHKKLFIKELQTRSTGRQLFARFGDDVYSVVAVVRDGCQALLKCRVSQFCLMSQDVIDKLDKFDDYGIVLLSFSDGGWSNIETVVSPNLYVEVQAELYPVFSENV